MRKERGTFGDIGTSWEKTKKRKELERRKKKGEKERTNHSQKSTSFGEKEGDLAFQRVLTLKSSLRVKLGAH